MKKNRTHSEFLKALLSDKRLSEQKEVVQEVYDQLFYPDYIQDKLDRIQELSSDIGFMGSPEYNKLRKEADAFMADRAEKEKERKEYEEFLRLKKKFEGPFMDGITKDCISASTCNFNNEDGKIIFPQQFYDEKR